MAAEILLLILRALTELAVLALGTALGIEVYFRFMHSRGEAGTSPVLTS